MSTWDDKPNDYEHALKQIERLEIALKFCRDIAEEELPHARIGTGAEVALRHIARKANENLSR